MTYTDVLPLCQFFRGEQLAPPSFNRTDRRLWLAEKMVCENFPYLVKRDDPLPSLARAVYSYLGKWFPYNADDYMYRYTERNPEIRKTIV